MARLSGMSRFRTCHAAVAVTVVRMRTSVRMRRLLLAQGGAPARMSLAALGGKGKGKGSRG